jgi:hypothetical protein
MSDEVQQAPNETPEKDPADWVTGDEPMDRTAAELSAHIGAGGAPRGP